MLGKASGTVLGAELALARFLFWLLPGSSVADEEAAMKS